MGFRQGGYMTVWSAEPSKTGNTSRVRLSSSRKNKNTGEYEQDFSAYCTFIGDAHKKAGDLKEKDRIRITECDVGTTYDKEKRVGYTNYLVFGFDMAGGVDRAVSYSAPAKRQADISEGELDEDNLPF